MDDCDDLAVDESQFVLLACHSDSDDFPSAPKEKAHVDRGMDAYVVKLDPKAGTVLWAVRLGGSNYDGAFRIHVDVGGGVWVAGYTESLDFPTTPNAVQERFGGGQGDAFVARLDSAGRLTYATYLGGAGSDQATGIVTSPRTGLVHLIGMTSSVDLPQARNAHNGREDAFLASLDPSNGESLRISYIGGREDEKPTGIALQRDDQLVVAGYTFSRDFPVRAAFQQELPGKTSAFLVRISALSGEVSSSTFFGGSGEDSVWGLAVSQTGDIHLLGNSNSSDFPTTPDSFQATVAGGFDTFVASFDPTAQRLRFSSRFGGSGHDLAGVDGKNLAVDSQGRIWFIGMTESRDVPLQHAHQSSFGGGDRDGFIAALSADGKFVEYSSYHGGQARDLLEGVFVAGGIVYATGLSFGAVPFRGPQLQQGGAGNAILLGLKQ